MKHRVLVACIVLGVLIGVRLPAQRAAGQGPATLGPRVLFADVASGPTTGGPNNQGVPISIFGKGFGATRGASKVTIGGVEVARYLIWGVNNAHNTSLDMIVVQPGPAVASGPIVVNVNNQASNADYTFTVAPGRIYYIATNGIDSPTCTAAAPCATIQHVLGHVMQPGDLVLVEAGTYSESDIWIRGDQGQSGQAGHPKVIKNYPGAEVHLTTGSSAFNVDADFITVSGLNFENGKSLEMDAWASPRQQANVFINNTFHSDFGWDAIHVEGDNHIVAGNVCDMSSSSVGTEGHCYYVSQGENAQLRYNIASGEPGYGIHLYDEVRSSSDFRRIIKNVLIEGNILKSSTERSGLLIAMSDCSDYYGGKCYGNYIDGVLVRNNILTGNNFVGVQVEGISRNVKLFNNTFYQNGRQGINIDNAANINSVDVRNNLIYQPTNSNCQSNCSWFPLAHIQFGSYANGVVVHNNYYYPRPVTILDENGQPVTGKDTHPVTGTVQFANPASLDFHLQAGSAVVDQGETLVDVPYDYDRVSRPWGAAFDIGAFEYVSPNLLWPYSVYLPLIQR